MSTREKNLKEFLEDFIIHMVAAGKLSAEEAIPIRKFDLTTKEKQKLAEELAELHNKRTEATEALLEMIPSREKIQALIAKIQEVTDKRTGEFMKYWIPWLESLEQKSQQ